MRYKTSLLRVKGAYQLEKVHTLTNESAFRQYVPIMT